MSNITSMHERVAAAIRDGRVNMKPRWHFILSAVLAVLGGVIAACLLLYCISFIIFMLQQTGVAFVPLFGLRGWLSFLRHLPWLLIVLSVIFVVLLEIFVRRYSFAYRRPLLYSAAGIVVLVMVGGFVVARTSFHPQMLFYAREHRLPFGESLYRDLDERRFGDVYRGIVVATTSRGFVLQDRQGTSSVIVTEETLQPRQAEIVPGAFFIVFGDVSSGTIEAIGIHPGPARMK